LRIIRKAFLAKNWIDCLLICFFFSLLMFWIS
jgi:hypothetical protein